MFMWRQLVPTMSCWLLLATVIGCTPKSSTPLDEEKDPFVGMGRRQETALDFTRAIESYHRALENNPGNSVAHYRLAWLYDKNDRDPAAAIYHFQRFLALRPNSEHAALINQRIIGCKQSLAKDVALGPISDEMQQRLEELARTTHELRTECDRLTAENQALKARLAAVDSSASRSSNESLASTRTTPPPVRSQGTQRSTTHTVQRGDTYYSIANRYGVSTASLQAANPGVDPRQLKIGMQVIVPAR